MNDSNNQRDNFKAVILGGTGVGKTALVTRWTTGTYSSVNHPTIGANHQRKRVTIDNQEVDIFLWDTAGQEQFQALTPLYARSSCAAILTTAINNMDSFTNIDKWIELLNTSTDESPPIILAVNKIDLETDNVMTHDKIITDYENKFAGIFFVSAATNEGVDNLFNATAQKGFEFAKANSHKVDQPVPAEPNKKNCC